MHRMTQNWLITGGCGFIGINLIKRLIEDENPHQILVLDNLSVGKFEHLNEAHKFTKVNSIDEAKGAGYFFIEGDILDENLAKSVTKNIDVVVHLAANTGVQPSLQNPVMDMQNNVIGVVNYLEAAVANGVKNFVLASSGAPTGDVEPPIHENLPCRPMSPYGASKLAGEGYCSAYYHSFGLNTIALRFSNVYGELSFHKGSVVAHFTKQKIKGEPVTVNGDGTQTRDFIYVGDLVRGIIKAGKAGFGGEVIQIATGVETSILELKDIMSKAAEKHFGSGFEFNFGKPLKGDMPKNYAQITKAKKLLNWQPEVNLEEGLDKVMKWFSDNHHKF